MVIIKSGAVRVRITESLVYIRYGVQYNVVLPVQFRIIWAALLSQCQKGEATLLSEIILKKPILPVLLA